MPQAHGPLGDSYTNLTEILPIFYDFLPWLPYTSLSVHYHRLQVLEHRSSMVPSLSSGRQLVRTGSSYVALTDVLGSVPLAGI